MSTEPLLQVGDSSIDRLDVNFRTLFEATPGLYLVVLSDGPIYTIVAANRAYAAATLTRPEEIIGRPLFEVFPDNPEDPHATGVRNLSASLRRVLATKAADRMPVQRYDIRCPESQGGGFEERYWSPVNSPVFNADGEMTHIIHCVEDVTERKRVERETGESETRFRNLADHAPVMVWVTEADGACTYLNRGWYEFTGQTEETGLGLGWLEATHPDDKAEAERVFLEANARHEAFRLEYRLRRKDGAWRWAIDAATPRFGHDGVFLGYAGSVIDITERKEMEEALRQSEAKYRTLFDSIDEGFCIIEMLFDERGKAYDYRFLEANPVFEKQTGLVGVTGRTVREFVQNLEEHWFEFYGRVALTGEPMRFENHSPALGRWFDVYAFRNGEPSEHQVAVLFKDISAQKEAAAEREGLLQQIRAERERLQQTFAQAPVAIAMFHGRDFVVELANPSYQALLQGRDIVGHRLADVVPELEQVIRDAFHGVMDTGKPFTGTDIPMPYDQDGDGVSEDHWFDVVYEPFRELDGTVSGIVGVGREVTAQVLARRELERVNRGLEEFAHVASHDLQEPLRMVNSYSQLLIRRLCQEATDEQKEFAGFIQRGVKRMEQIIKDLLSYSRTVHMVDETALSMANLSEALRQALAAVDTRVAETGATLTYEPLPTVRGDTVQLGHVFQNLLSNALKYRRPSGLPRIHISAQKQESAWVVSIRDNGIGFDPSQAERIFGLFKRLHREDEYPGTGLGLAICRRIVERYGGRMWAESEPGAGSTFFLSLPGAPS